MERKVSYLTNTVNTSACVGYSVNTSGSSNTLFSFETELLPLRGGGSDDFDPSIFLVPGVGIELLLVLDQGCRTKFEFGMPGATVIVGGVKGTLTVGADWGAVESEESKLLHTLGLLTCSWGCTQNKSHIQSDFTL